MKRISVKEVLAKTTNLKKEKKVGFVAIIGRPNVGKSTFINNLIGEKISITTNIPQTTRKKVLAIFNDDDSQIIFFDTPGIHKSEKKFNEEINNVAINSLKESEIILYFIDSTREGGEEESFIKNIVSKINKPILKVYTKTDLKSKINILNKKDCVKISSLKKIGFEELLEKIKLYLKKGPILFPEEIYTKQDIFFRIGEIIREKTFLNTKEEIPHSIYIGVEEIEDKKDILKIVAYIYAESDSQKYIIIGKAGNLIQKIGKESRKEIEKIFEKKVFLALRVKVKKHWRKDKKLVKRLLN